MYQKEVDCFASFLFGRVAFGQRQGTFGSRRSETGANDMVEAFALSAGTSHRFSRGGLVNAVMVLKRLHESGRRLPCSLRAGALSRD